MLQWKCFKNFTKSSFRLILNDIKYHLKVKIKNVNKFQFSVCNSNINQIINPIIIIN